MHHTFLLFTVNSYYRPFKLVYSLFMHFSDLARILNRHVCKLELYSSIFMHWMDPRLTLNSQYCTPEFFCFILQILSLLSAVIITHACCTLLHLCILQTCNSLVIIAHLSSILVFLCIAQTLQSLLAVIDAHPSSVLVFLCIAPTLLSPQQSFFQVRALVCSFHAFDRPSSHTKLSILRILAQLYIFLCIPHT